jgi:ABC-2 type transport system permease protein
VRRNLSARRRIGVVARREFVATVTRPSYIVTLLAMPLLMAAVGLLPAIGIALSGGPQKMVGLKAPDETTHVGLVDVSGRVAIDPALVAWHNADQEAAVRERRQRRDAPSGEGLPKLPKWLADTAGLDAADRGGFDPDVRIELRLLASEQEARLGMERGDLDVAYVIDEDWLRLGKGRVLLPKRNLLDPGFHPGQRAVARLIRRSLAGPFVSDEIVLARLVEVLDPTEVRVGKPDEGAPPKGIDESIAAVLPLLFASFFALSVFVASGYLLDGIGEEKENRVLEVLLATLSPEELLAGKIVGLGAAGLLQSLAIALVGLGPLTALGLLAIGPGKLLAMFACAALGYAEYASVMAASGAVAGSRHEGRQISAVFSLTAASPMFVLPVFLAGADGMVARVLSMFPPTAPIAMTLRLGLVDVPARELALCLGGMAFGAWLSWRAGARVFRVAVLLTGARPPLRTIGRWIWTG